MDTIDTLTMNGQTLFGDSDLISSDPVDSPPHYTHGKIECIEAIREIVRRIDDGEEGYYADIEAHHDYDEEKFGKIYDYEEKNPKLFGTVLDPETGKEMIQHSFMGGKKDGDYMDDWEGAWDDIDNRYFNTQEELINFDLEKLLKDINQKKNK